MDMEIYFPGGKRVYADYKGFTIESDQPVIGGGDNSAPAPFDLFMDSIGTCAGIYVLGFMQQRGIPTEGARLLLSKHVDRQTGLVDKIDITVHLPAGFPEKYRAAVVNAVNLCAVKKHLHQPPAFEVTTVVGETASV
jgi:ribosomal protein S12 methylthiotransferase accessory factor